MQSVSVDPPLPFNVSILINEQKIHHQLNTHLKGLWEYFNILYNLNVDTPRPLLQICESDSLQCVLHH